MNRDYKLRFDQMRENSPSQTEPSSQSENQEFYQNDGHIREFCLVWKNGCMDFIPYSYVMYRKFRFDDISNTIVIELPSKIVTLSGYGLQTLALSFMKQLPQFIYETDERYADQTETIVTKIVVEEKS